MYINYVNDRKLLLYQALKDTAYGIETVRMRNSIVLNFSTIDG